MTVFNPPGFLQNAGNTHTAEQLRNYIAGFLRSDGSTPIRPNNAVIFGFGGNLQVRASAPAAMTVVVPSGLGYLAGTEGSIQGTYAVMNDGDVVVTIATAHATLGRIDLVVVRVRDSQYSGGTNNVTIESVTGTAASVPLVPTPPANCMVLAQVFVNAAATTIVDANITDCRPFISRLIRKTADETISSASAPQADDHLFFNMNGSAGRYLVRGGIYYAATDTADFRWNITGPSSTGGKYGGHGPASTFAAAANTGDFYGRALVINDGNDHVWGGKGAGSTNMLYGTFEAMITAPTNAGTYRFNWSQFTTEASNATVFADSWLEVIRQS